MVVQRLARCGHADPRHGSGAVMVVRTLLQDGFIQRKREGERDDSTLLDGCAKTGVNENSRFIYT